MRTGTVIDLQIRAGRIQARVQGRRKAPYKVEIHISPLKEEDCQRIMQACANQIENLEALLSGEFPQSLQELFTGESGLFPSPREISFQCSCPDWAIMCKHVAAVLYGVGNRLDENPFLFFTLRGIDLAKFIDVAIGNKVEMMLEHANEKSARIMDNATIHDVFGL
ncbi:MAG: SWIM zinc finger family protein [[Clostridium] innocuum]